MAKNPNSPLQRIRQYCLGCCGTAHEVKLCPVEKCPLWPLRSGHNPFAKKREMTEEQRAAVAERFRQAREKKNAK
jgi:hypothetical protein